MTTSLEPTPENRTKVWSAAQLPLIWAHASVVYDSPDKKSIEAGEERGRLMSQDVEGKIGQLHSELLMVTPYFAPSQGESNLLRKLSSRGATVKVLTNSLESAPSLAAQSGYDHDRLPLARAGVQFYEIRSLLDDTAGSGQTRQISRYGNYALHAKLYVFDRGSSSSVHGTLTSARCVSTPRLVCSSTMRPLPVTWRSASMP